LEQGAVLVLILDAGKKALNVAPGVSEISPGGPVAEGFAGSQGRPCCLVSISPADPEAVGLYSSFKAAGVRALPLR